MKKKKLLIVLSSFLILVSGCEKLDKSPNNISPENTSPSKISETPSSPQQTDPAPSAPASPSPSASQPIPEETAPPAPPPQEQSPDPSVENKLLASFATTIMDHGKARMTNLKLAAKAIDGYVVKAGEEFSFNAVVGKRTKERGYQKAITYVNGEKVKDYGGGICQISTTLYNAALNAQLNVTERHEHGVEVPYIEKGKDATVDYENLDLKFQNPFDYSIMLSVSVSKNEVNATISR